MCGDADAVLGKLVGRGGVVDMCIGGWGAMIGSVIEAIAGATGSEVIGIGVGKVSCSGRP